MDGQLPRHAGKHGRVYGRSAALCLEPQQFPDAPNQRLFPACMLQPGERVRGQIEYRFSVSA
jgi:aldose 1-epimerase